MGLTCSSLFLLLGARGCCSQTWQQGGRLYSCTHVHILPPNKRRWVWGAKADFLTESYGGAAGDPAYRSEHEWEGQTQEAEAGNNPFTAVNLHFLGLKYLLVVALFWIFQFVIHTSLFLKNWQCCVSFSSRSSIQTFTSDVFPLQSRETRRTVNQRLSLPSSPSRKTKPLASGTKEFKKGNSLHTRTQRNLLPFTDIVTSPCCFSCVLAREMHCGGFKTCICWVWVF